MDASLLHRWIDAGCGPVLMYVILMILSQCCYIFFFILKRGQSYKTCVFVMMFVEFKHMQEQVHGASIQTIYWSTHYNTE